MADRPLVASAATGSASSLLLWLLKEAFSTPPVVAPAAPDLPRIDLDCDCLDRWELPKLDFWSGLLLGVLLWPLVELAVLCKQWVTLAIRNRIAQLGQAGDKLYRVLG